MSNIFLRHSFCIYLASVFLLLQSISAQAQTVRTPTPVNFEADNIVYDHEDQLVSADGHVVLEQDGRRVTADKIIYSIPNDRVTALGNVVMHEADGAQFYASQVILNDQLQTGYVAFLRGTILSGGRFSADSAERTMADGDRIMMHNATYTACPECKKKPDASPIWLLRAEEVIYERNQKQVSYKNARLELGGVPVLWTPYFSHPDGTEDQRSGLVEPILGYDSALGAYGGASYYYALDKDKDLTVGMTAYAKELPVVSGEYRQRFDSAAIGINATGTHSGRVVEIGGENTTLNEEWRGNVEATGLWDITSKWRTGFDINLTSDDQYLRQYDISDDDILENELYLERFSGRNYSDIRLIGFQDVRLLENRTDSPNILPEINLSFFGEPNETLGGRWSFDMSALSLQRSGADPDTNRVSSQVGWQTRKVTDFGLVNTIDLMGRGDVYYLTDQPGYDEKSETRGLATANWEASYPLIKSFKESAGRVVVEPTLSLTTTTNLDDQSDILNEDSQDIQIGVHNLFNANRFTGYDRIEDSTKTTYGLRTTYYAPQDIEIGAFAGQSYNFSKGNTLFPEGSGLTERTSDYVTQLTAKYKDILDVNYRAQWDENNVNSKRQEVDALYTSDTFELYGLYFFSKAVEDTNFDETREYFRGGSRFRVTDNWYASSGVSYDLGEDPGLRGAEMGVEYIGDCLSVGSFITRDLTNDSSGDAATEISIRIGLKTLGNFKASSNLLFEDQSEE